MPQSLRRLDTDQLHHRHHLGTPLREFGGKKACPRSRRTCFRKGPYGGGVKLEPGEVWQEKHSALMGKGIPLILFVTSLSQIGSNKFVLIALPLKMKGADGSPARVVALVE